MEKIPTQILLIEDNPADTVLLREALEQDTVSSFTVTVTDHLSTGISLLQQDTFDIVLLDLGLPDSQGLETFIQLHKQVPDTPAIILSGLMDEELALQAIQLGAQDYLLKRQELWGTAARSVRYSLERQQAQIALRESENRFRLLFEHTPVAYQSLDANGVYVDCNARLCDLIGYEPYELLGERFEAFCTVETRSLLPGKFERFRKDGKLEADLQLVKKDGTVIEVYIQGKIQYDINGQVVRTHCILHDITARKLTDQALRESQERFSTVFRSNPLGIAITELVDGTIIDVNEAFVHMFGYKRSELLRHTTFELNMWQNLAEHERIIKKLRRHGEVTNIEIKFHGKTGETITALASYRLIELDGRQRVLNMLNDITDRRQTEQALSNSEKRFHALLENGLDNISLINAEGILLWENPASIRTLDYKPDEFGGRNIFELVHPDDRQRIERPYAELVQTPGSRKRDTFRLRHSDGSWHWVEAIVTNLLDQPSVNAIVVNYRDISEQKELEQALYKSEMLFLQIFQFNPIPLAIEDSTGTIVTVNESYLRFTGYQAEEVIGNTIKGLNLYADPHESAQTLQALPQPVSGNEKEFRLQTKSGEIRSVLDRNEQITLTANDQKYLHALVDITKYKQMEQVLLASQESFRNIFESAPVGIFQSTSAGRFLKVNPTMAKIYGFASPEAMLANITDIASQIYVNPSDREAFARSLQENAEVHDFAGENLRQDGAHIWTQTSARTVKDNAGNLLYYEGFIREVTDRKQAEDKLRISESNYRWLAEKSIEGIAIYQGQKMVYTNPAMCRIFGYTTEEFLAMSGEQIVALTHPHDHSIAQEYIRKYTADEFIASHIEVRILKKDGTTGWVQTFINQIEYNGQPAILSTNIDITEHKQSELELKRSTAEFAALYETTKDLAFELNVSKLLEQIVERTNNLLESSGGFIYLYEPDQNDLNLVVATELGVPLGTRLKIGEGMAGKVALTRKAMIVENYQNWPDQADIYANQPFRSIVEVPMLSGGELIGVLGVEVKGDSTRIFKESDARLLSLFAGYAASAVRNVRLLNQSSTHAQQMNLLYDAGLRLNRELNPRMQFELLFEMIQRTLNANTVIFFRYENAQHELYPETGLGAIMAHAELKKLRFTLGEERGLVGWVAKNRVPLYLANVQADERWINIDSAAHSVMWMPIEHEQQLLGVLAIESTQVDAFSKEDQQLVVLFSNQLSIAFENARLFTALNAELTERKRAEEALALEKHKAQQYLDIAGIIILALDQNGIVTMANQKACELLGYPYEEIVGKDWINTFLPPSVRAELKEVLKQLIAGNDKAFAYHENLILTKNGDERLIAWNNILFRDSNGAILSTLSSGEDITERRFAEEALRESEQRYRTLIDQTPAAVYIDDSSTYPSQTEFISPYLKTMLGFTPAEWIQGGMELWQAQLHPEDRERALDEYKRSIQNNQPLDLEYRLYTRDGHTVWIHDQAVALRDNAGKPHSVHGVMYDITERKKTEIEHQILLDIMKGAISITDLTEYLQLVHHSIARLIQAKNFFVVLHNKDTGLFEEVYSVDQYDPPQPPSKLEKSISAYVFRSGKPLILTQAVFDELAAQGAVELIGKNSPSWLGVPLLTSKKTIGVMVVQDYENANQYSEDDKDFLVSIAGQVSLVVERKQAEAESAALNRQLELILNSAGDGIYGVNKEGQLTFINPIAAQMLGWEISELIGRHAHDMFHHTRPDGRPYPADECPNYMTFQDGIARSVSDEVFWRRDGSNFPVEYTSTPVYEGDRIVGTVVVVRDVTQRKETEAALNYQLSELEALYENGLAISSMLEPKQIAHRMVEVLGQKLEWHHSAVRIYHPESDHLELLALNQPGLDTMQINAQIERVNQFNINPDNGLSGWVIKHRKAFRSGDLRQHPNYVETYPGIKSGLYVPIRSGEEIIGSIAVESEKENAFAERDERLLTTMANQAAISFVNARLYLRLQHELSERRQTEEKIRKLNAQLEQRVQERTIEIETAHQRLELATASSGIGIWELTAGRDTFYWDERMHALYGTQPNQFTPTLSNWEALIHPDDRQAEQAKRLQAIQQGGYYANEYRIIRKDGSLGYINSNAVVLLDEHRNFKDMIGVNLDITTMKQAEATLRLANHELERALRIKDEFLANMSHELRTPLNAILGLSESLEEQIAGELNEKQLRYMHTISESGRHLLSLINDILDLAKIEAGQIKLDITKTDIYAVSQTSLRMVKQLAQKKNQQIEVDIDNRIDLIWVDERRIKQMLVNLLSNAIKFTHEGGKIGLTIKINEPENKILITVWDSGIGIKEHDLPRLFKPFVQLDGGLARESNGTGLGLALVAQMARLHGGSVAVTSQVGAGSRFTITLPWEPALTADTTSKLKFTEKSPVIKTRPGAGQPTILLVEDTDEVVMMVSDYLEAAGYKVVTAKNGIDAIAQAKQFHPALILMDVQMPGMTGLEAAQALRGEADFQHTPIIALTALAMQSDRERCLAAGMNEYMSKPVNLKMLVMLIQGFLSKT